MCDGRTLNKGLYLENTTLSVLITTLASTHALPHALARHPMLNLSSSIVHRECEGVISNMLDKLGQVCQLS